MKRFSLVALFALLGALVLGLGQVGLTQTAQGIVVVPPSSQISVTINVDQPDRTYLVGEQIRLFIQTTAPNVSQVYLNVVDIDAAGHCTLIYPNAFSPNPLVTVGTLVLPDRASYNFQVVPPAGTEYVQAFASLQPLNLQQIFNAPVNPGDPFPLLCTNPATFAQQVQAAAQGIIAVGQLATGFASFTVLGSVPLPPPPPPLNHAPIASFAVNTSTALVGQPVQFFSNSTDPDVGDFIVQQFWNFGDGGTALGQTASHSYFFPGTFQVTLTVTDNHGASGAATQFITVISIFPQPPPPPPTLQAGFYVDAVDSTHIRVAIQGSPLFSTDRAFQIHMETDGLFTSVEQQTFSGSSIVGQGIVPVPVSNSLDLNGTIRNGRIEYIIGFSFNASKIKFNLRLDTNGDGQLERQRSFVFLGAQLKNPPSNPFVITFTAGTLLPFTSINVCLVVIDVPGFQFLICSPFGSL